MHAAEKHRPIDDCQPPKQVNLLSTLTSPMAAVEGVSVRDDNECPLLSSVMSIVDFRCILCHRLLVVISFDENGGLGCEPNSSNPRRGITFPKLQTFLFTLLPSRLENLFFKEMSMTHGLSRVLGSPVQTSSRIPQGAIFCTRGRARKHSTSLLDIDSSYFADRFHIAHHGGFQPYRLLRVRCGRLVHGRLRCQRGGLCLY